MWVVRVFVEFTPEQEALFQVFFPHGDGDAHPLFSEHVPVSQLPWGRLLAQGVEEVSIFEGLTGIIAKMRPVAREVLVHNRSL